MIKQQKLRKIIREEVQRIKKNSLISEKIEGKEEQMLDAVINKKLSAKAAYDLLQGPIPEHFDHKDLDEKGIKYGSGNLEKSLANLGYKFKPADAKKFDLTELSSFVHAVFYVGAGNDLFPKSFWKELVKIVSKDPKDETVAWIMQSLSQPANSMKKESADLANALIGVGASSDV